jgi:N-acetylgalactosamine-6-sulfatase
MRLILSTFLFCACITHTYAQQVKPRKPNVIFILADDLGWGDLSCYGGRKIQTPNIDALSKEGTLFTQFYQAGSVCSPSRSALLTGRFPARDSIHTAIEVKGEGNEGKGVADHLDPNISTLPDLMVKNGYVTGHYGKWHLGATKSSPSPHDYGITEHRTGNSNDPNKLPRSDRSNSSKVIVDEAISFIERNKDKPFYVNAWLYDVHAVLNPSKEQLDAVSHLGISDKVPFHSPAQVYYGTLREMDIQVGRLLQRLRELGLDQHTIVIFSSDNGPEDINVVNASHSGVGSTGPLRGRKRSLYEGGVRVPFIVRWPGKVPSGTVNTRAVIGGADLLSTVCGLTGTSMSQTLFQDGEDRSAILLGKEIPRKKPLLWEWRYGMPGHLIDKSPGLAIREGNWKLLINHNGTRLELYDIEADPMELNNVAALHKDVCTRLSGTLLAWQKTLPPGGLVKDAGNIDYPWPK